MQNGTASPIETAADGFLNWVRHSFGDLSGENHAQQWRNFFSQNIGMFLRNAVIYTYGMAQFYLEQEIITEPLFSAAKGESRLIRLHPSDNDNNLLGGTTTYLDSMVEVYGLLPAPGGLGENSRYWLLVRDTQERLVWVAALALVVNQDELDEILSVHGAVPQSLIDTLLPNTAYTTDHIEIITGEYND